MEKQFTKGPWSLLTSRDWNYINAHGNVAKVPVSDYCAENGIKDEEAFANARLIAAAPEMFELLERYLNCEGDIESDVRALLTRITTP